MNYNNHLCYLNRWCVQKTNDYYVEYSHSQRGSLYLKYILTNETAFKLMQLVDCDFADDAAFYESIVKMMGVHYDFSLKRELTYVEKHMLNKVEEEFLAYVKQLIYEEPPQNSLDDFYQRVLAGTEADDVIAKINLHWMYDNRSYWFPLMGDEPVEVTNKFFIMAKYVAPYWDEIRDYLLKENNRIYSYGQSFYDINFCIETSTIDNIEHEEWIYTDKCFKWFIYFSHEGTVSFAGTIVPDIKEILQKEKEHWDRYEYPEF